MLCLHRVKLTCQHELMNLKATTLQIDEDEFASLDVNLSCYTIPKLNEIVPAMYH